MRFLLISIIAIHGLIHLMGFTKAFGFAAVNQIKQSISRPVGLLWLLCAILFIAAAVFFFLGKQQWWMLAGLGVILSQIVIALSWSDAKEGTLFNLIILVPLVLAFINAQPSSYRNIYQAEVRKALKPSNEMPVVTEEDLELLPDPVQKYLRYTGAVGKPKVRNFRARFTGTMKTKKDGNWLAIASRQYDFFDDPARMFFIESSMFGLPFDGLQQYDSFPLPVNRGRRKCRHAHGDVLGASWIRGAVLDPFAGFDDNRLTRRDIPLLAGLRPAFGTRHSCDADLGCA